MINNLISNAHFFDKHGKESLHFDKIRHLICLYFIVIIG